MRALYNEIETYCCDWLSNLMDAGLITPGKIDDRSIKDLTPDDVVGYDRVHFFAGLGGWDLALQLAGWGGAPVWTGSCPCQPFSAAGAQKGFDDERHLWPFFRGLIDKRRPPVVFGEQVAAASKWLNLVRSDLEAMDYAVGAIPMEAASADADHFRDRYWFVADYDIELSAEGRLQRSGELRRASGPAENNHLALADGECEVSLSGAHGRVCPEEKSSWSRHVDVERYRSEGVQAFNDSIVVDLARIGWGEGWTEHEFRSRGFTAAVANCDGNQYVECSDGKWRRLPPPRVRWMGTGVPARVAKLRAIGNAIDPRPAVAFIRAYMDCAL